MRTAAVIGSGLSGLVAALRLQRQGYRVRILEQRPCAGGLCGTQELDGYQFTLACNDFGRALAREIHSLGVEIGFHQPETRFCFSDRTVTMPATMTSALRLLPRLPEILRFVRGVRAGADYMGPLVAETVRNPRTADLIHSLAYPLGTGPDRLALSVLRAQFCSAYRYGYDEPHTPAGGPGALVRALVKRFEAQGGELELGIACGRIETDGDAKVVHTSDGDRIAGCIVSSAGRWGEYPARLAPSLAVNMVLFAVRETFRYPAKLHTLVHFPPGIASWMRTLESGALPPAFGFHVFPSEHPPCPGHRTFNVFTLAPRGVSRLESTERERVVDYVLRHLDAQLPGFSRAIIYRRFLSAGEFRDRTGLSTHLIPRVVDAGFEKPRSYDPWKDIYHVGNSVQPPGEHAGAAILSARLAAEAIGPAETGR